MDERYFGLEMCDDDCEMELTIKTTHSKVIFYELMIILFSASTRDDEYMKKNIKKKKNSHTQHTTS